MPDSRIYEVLKLLDAPNTEVQVPPLEEADAFDQVIGKINDLMQELDERRNADAVNQTRIAELIDVVAGLIALDYSVSAKVSGKKDIIDILAASLNVMSEEIQSFKITQNYLSNILHSMIDLLVVINLDGVITRVNRALLNLLEYEEHELLGQPIGIFLDGEADAKREFAETLLKKTITHGEHRFQTKNGKIILVFYSTSNIYDINGNVSSVVCVAQDITEKRQSQVALLMSRSRLSTAQRIAHLGHWDLDVVKGDLYWSDETYRIFGLNPQEFGATYDAFRESVHPDDRQMVQDGVNDALEKGIPYNLEHRVVRPDGVERIVNEQAEVTYDEKGLPIRMVGTVLDITERKQIENDLKRARDSAESANRAKSIFIANMSHELRTPLNAILGFAQLLDQMPSLEDDIQEYVGLIMRSGDHLLGLINDILYISKIEAGRLELRTTDFDLHKLLMGLESVFRVSAEEKGLSFNFDIAPSTLRYVHTDKGKLRQAIINLLGNAIKFTGHGSVGLRIWSQNEDSEQADLFIEVSDTGVGISENEYDVLFDPFTQSDAGEKMQEGTGLGLAISQDIVELMGGVIQVESIIGEGSTFRVELPIKSGDPVLVASGIKKRVTGIKSDQRKYRLLVADDKWENRLTLSKTLEAVGFEVQEASNGQEAVAIWREWQPDLIWMDIRMPVMNGYEAAGIIKEDETAKQTVVIALTAGAFDHEKSMILEAGCDDFIVKPYKLSDVFDKLTKHLDIEFEYEVPDDLSESKTIDAEDDYDAKQAINALSDKLRDDLSLAAATLNVTSSAQIIEEIHKQDEKLASLLKKYADNFDFKRIQTLLRNED